MTVDDLEVSLRWSSRRRTLGLTVERDGTVSVAAPVGTELEFIEQFVRDRRLWIYTKLAQKDAMLSRAPVKEFVTGEGFSYLGRSHRLRLVDSQDVPLKLMQGRFHLLRSEEPRARGHFIDWYTQRAHVWIAERMPSFAARLGVYPSSITVRDLGYRWGSCGGGGKLYFHWATIQLPPRIIEYVIVHELVHLIVPHHTHEFWRLLESALSDCEARKSWLARFGGACLALGGDHGLEPSPAV